VAAVVAGVVVVAAGSVAALAAAGVFSRPGHPGSGGTRGTATGVVSRQTLTSQTAVNATLGYAGSYTVTGRVPGTVTWLPAPGRVIREGGVLYRTGNGVPAYLLYGRVPAWRTLQEGMRGGDVRQLNHDLAALGYANSGYISALGWDYFSWETSYGLERLQGAAGLRETGELPLGQAVFEPGALRVSAVSALLGSPASGQIFTATSARPVVTISLNASEQPEVKTGDKVSVTMPDGTPTPGVISSVGNIASGTGSSATITVDVRLLHPKAAGGLDQAPVTVEITTGSVKNALVVPVDALLARPGGYAVEVVGASGTHHLVPVRVGMFDNAAGLVQVSGPGLAVGQHVVVPSL
jgi:peptidoglycan hydrolase-like protein with peptidoglycan-binding domain